MDSGVTVKQSSVEAIKELNLSFLILAKQIISEDREAAMLALGVDSDAIEILEKLTPGQIVRMANTDMLLCAFRFDDELLIRLLAAHDRPESVSKTHAAILALGKPVATI